MGRKAQSGGFFKIPSAAQQNAWDEAGENYRSRELSDGKGKRRDRAPTDVIYAKNLSGATRREGDILEIGAGKLITTLDAKNLWLQGNTPGGTSSAPIGVLLQSTPDDVIDRVQMSGVCMAWVDIQEDGDRYAKAEDSSYVLTSSSASGPVHIIYPESGETGETWCCVRLSNPTNAISFGIYTFEQLTTDGASQFGTGYTKTIPWEMYAADGWSYDADADTLTCTTAGTYPVWYMVLTNADSHGNLPPSSSTKIEGTIAAYRDPSYVFPAVWGMTGRTYYYSDISDWLTSNPIMPASVMDMITVEVDDQLAAYYSMSGDTTMNWDCQMTVMIGPAV